MQVLVLIVQNDARPQDMGVVTSTATFFRSVGGSFGVALFGAIFASRLASELTRLPADVTAKLGDVGAIDPAPARSSCRPRCAPTSSRSSRTRSTASSSWGMVIAIVPAVLAWFLKEVPLRTTLGQRRPLPSRIGARGAVEPEVRAAAR